MKFWHSKPKEARKPNVIGGAYDGEPWENGTSDGQECWTKRPRQVYRWCADKLRWVEVALYRGLADMRCRGK